ncbi:MAG: valine--tRNA ligase, partial [Actinobacteria bacterium]|nr:valine--tRNA ligase [Actinomycetota bacterium]
MNENAGKYCGLDRYKARKKIVEDLEQLGYIAGVKDHTSSAGTCSRCDTVIEPRISNQWFVSMQGLAAPAIAAVRNGRIRFVPKKWEKIYFNWMENIRDWCISRQLWWGHRIPVWYCMECNEMIVAELTPRRCKCGSKNLVQDNDVLDTWFSSCLWPFATMGWPQKTDDLAYFFPTSVLITAHDIIFFWVARMIMMSLYFMKEVPFREVFINPLVNDVFGQKMSKSRGNVIDPLTIIEKNGTDALRLTLASLTTPGKNLLLGEEKIEGSRNFVNKLWNASKFVISSLEKAEAAEGFEDIKITELDFNLWDRWILSKFARVLKTVERYIEKYGMSFACRALTGFFWNDYCDWYIESAKLRLYNKEACAAGTDSVSAGNTDTVSGSVLQVKKNKTAAAFVLWYILERYLRLLHPFMPFVTEKIWQNLPHRGESIMVSEYPVLKDGLPEKIDTTAEKKIDLIFKIISQIRKIRSELKINPALKIKACIKPADEKANTTIKENELYILNLARLESLSFSGPADSMGYIKSAVENTGIYMYLQGIVDVDLETKRISSEILKLGTEKDKSLKKIENPQFVSRAPKEIINKEKSKLEKAYAEIKILQEQLELVKSLKKQ